MPATFDSKATYNNNKNTLIVGNYFLSFYIARHGCQSLKYKFWSGHVNGPSEFLSLCLVVDFFYGNFKFLAPVMRKREEKTHN